MKRWKLIVIPILLVILAVGAALAINVWSSGRVAPGTAPLEVRLQGVADWAKAEQGLDLLGEYTFVTVSEIDKEQIKKVYTYHLSDGSVFGHFIYQEEQQEQPVDSHYIWVGAGVDYAKAVVEAEAAHLGKDYYFSTFGFFAISDDPEALMGYHARCSEGWYYRG